MSERALACPYCRTRYHGECLPEKCRRCGGTTQRGAALFTMSDAPAFTACVAPLLAIGGFVLSFPANSPALAWIFGFPVAVGAKVFLALAAPDAASADELSTGVELEALVAGLVFTALCGALVGIVLRRLVSSREAAPERPSSAPSKGTSSPCAP